MKTDNANIVYGALIVGGLLAIRGIRSLFGGTRLSENLDDFQGIVLTDLSYQDVYYEILCDSIQTAIYGAIYSEDEAQVIADLSQMNTDDDVLKLILTYGKRKSGNPIIDLAMESKNLVTTVQQYLSNSDIDQVNENFQGKGITYRFYST